MDSGIKQVKVVLNKKGVRDLLKSQEIMNVCTELAYKAASKLGDGYLVTYQTGKNRVNASIKAVTPKARQEQLSDNTIIKALR